MPFLTESNLSYNIKRWDKSQVAPGTMPRLNKGPWRRPMLNLGNIPAIAGKTKLGQFPAIAGKKTVLQPGFELGIYFPAIAAW